ncbi:MAG: hypothetical protein C7B46_19295 [Sulfobacillus benefaciens]|jgi:hypothetical protein|uniref:Thoeris protein ThsB TIR-like domain-containing protein n=1 Tax=Sulfobacillus benefaciens TaxID=453960 RepID=A0A2T2WZS9_9FIRM|nr:MAG: hypothetical protein C7B46_19295 [Sulfobacillus benefaciens]
MAYRSGNYTAFYVSEPFHESTLGAHATKDFLYYNLLRAWKEKDKSFPFIDSHQKNYNVRDGSDWEKTLKPRLHDRLNSSKNIILFLSSSTKNSRALREEITFGVGELGLPVIVVYPEYDDKSDIVNCQSKTIQSRIQKLWGILPAFRDSMNEVPTLHIPLKKELISLALNNENFMVNSKRDAGIYFYPC